MLIYKITNDLNGKVYIGQTTKSLEDRIKNHHNAMISGVDNHLYNAMRKYGWEHFIFEIVVETDNKDTLDELERYYINKYDSIKMGYNMIPGGRSNPMDYKEVADKHHRKMRSDEIRKKISDSMKESYKLRGGASEAHRKHLSENKRNMYNSPQGEMVREKFRKSFHLSDAHYHALNDVKHKAVHCIDADDKIVAEFECVKDAANWWIGNGYNVSYKSVCASIKRSFVNDKYINGLKWIYHV